MNVYLVEKTVDLEDGFTTVWHCEPPARDVAYRVTNDIWEDTDGEVVIRRIYAWEPA